MKSMIFMKRFLLVYFLVSWPMLAQAETAYKIYGKSTSIDELMKVEQDKFYKIEKEKFELIDEMAKRAYIEEYWKKMAVSQKISVDSAREKYMNEHAKFTNKEMEETLKKYENHPKLKDLSQKEKETQIRTLLRVRSEQEIMQTIITDGMRRGELVVAYPRPKEPIYAVSINSDDHVRYGPADSDVKPQGKGCKGDDCLITILEYSEYQCPFCSRVIPTTKRLLEEYRGKIRWIVRDFPLNFHDRARPAGIAAQCAGFQKKESYWAMYRTLFENQQKLSDSDLESYAVKIGLDKAKYNKCVKEDSKKAEAIIDRNMKAGMSVGVTGTPAFFINGRRMSGALPYEEFKRVIEEELASKTKKAAKSLPKQ